MLLGGRVAEELILDDITTGASNDIERVTKMARKMVCEWGMSENIGTLSIGETGEEVFIGREWVQNKNYSEETAKLVDAEVKRIVQEAHSRCVQLLKDNEEILHRIAAALLERETITGDELDLLMNNEKLPPIDVGQAKTQQDFQKDMKEAVEKDSEDFQLENEPEEDEGQADAKKDQNGGKKE